MTRRGEEGFVLVEALAALVVTALVASALVAALHAARGYAREAVVRDAALRQARHLLAEGVAGAPERLPARGELPEARLVWSRTISPAPEAPGVLVVEVEVAWAAGRKEGATRLVTYRTAPR